MTQTLRDIDTDRRPPNTQREIPINLQSHTHISSYWSAIEQRRRRRRRKTKRQRSNCKIKCNERKKTENETKRFYISRAPHTKMIVYKTIEILWSGHKWRDQKKCSFYCCNGSGSRSSVTRHFFSLKKSQSVVHQKSEFEFFISLFWGREEPQSQSQTSCRSVARACSLKSHCNWMWFRISKYHIWITALQIETTHAHTLSQSVNWLRKLYIILASISVFSNIVIIMSFRLIDILSSLSSSVIAAAAAATTTVRQYKQ